jgi:hypothetical protein
MAASTHILVGHLGFELGLILLSQVFVIQRPIVVCSISKNLENLVPSPGINSRQFGTSTHCLSAFLFGTSSLPTLFFAFFLSHSRLLIQIVLNKVVQVFIFVISAAAVVFPNAVEVIRVW